MTREQIFFNADKSETVALMSVYAGEDAIDQ